MTKEEWLIEFEKETGRKPSADEFMTAKAANFNNLQQEKPVTSSAISADRTVASADKKKNPAAMYILAGVIGALVVALAVVVTVLLIRNPQTAKTAASSSSAKSSQSVSSSQASSAASSSSNSASSSAVSSSMNTQQIAEGNFTSLVGTWKNADGQYLTFSGDGSDITVRDGSHWTLQPHEANQSGIYQGLGGSSPIVALMMTTSQEDVGDMLYGLKFIPVGVSDNHIYGAVAQSSTDPTDTSRDRIIGLQGETGSSDGLMPNYGDSREASRAYYRVN